MQDVIGSDPACGLESHTVYCMDPYVIHRRPKKAKGKLRTLVRISFTPIEIVDCNNTRNAMLFRDYKRDGVRDFRDNLKRYRNLI